MLILSETRHCVTTSDVSSDWLNKQNNSQPLYEFNVFGKAKTPCIRHIKNLKKVTHLLLLSFRLRLSSSLYDTCFPCSSLVRRLFSLTLSSSLSSCSSVKFWPRRITPSSISIILHKILSLIHQLFQLIFYQHSLLLT